MLIEGVAGVLSSARSGSRFENSENISRIGPVDVAIMSIRHSFDA
jgi:hypothetical protein